MPNTPIKSVTVPQGQTTVTVDLHDARIISIDNQLVENSTNPVTSGAVYAVVGDINAVLEEVL